MNMRIVNVFLLAIFKRPAYDCALTKAPRFSNSKRVCLLEGSVASSSGSCEPSGE